MTCYSVTCYNPGTPAYLGGLVRFVSLQHSTGGRGAKKWSTELIFVSINMHSSSLCFLNSFHSIFTEFSEQ